MKKPVAGIAMGLIKENDGRVAILTDILGDEDHLGDMDFKVAGTKDGVTALQMDIKITSITKEIMQNALAQAHEGRIHILGEMAKALAAPRPEISPKAPRIHTMTIPTDKIREVIGTGGKVIREIIEKTNTKIDITDDGNVSICGTDPDAMQRAKRMVETIVTEFEEGMILEGKVVSIKDFGAFLEFAPGKEGMIHISKIAKERINHVEDVLTLGDVVKVVCLGKDKMGRFSFSIKDLKE
jgi:polyribonucleotide nucleotidyltransferase